MASERPINTTGKNAGSAANLKGAPAVQQPKGTNQAGQTVKLPDGSTYTLKGPSSGAYQTNVKKVDGEILTTKTLNPGENRDPSKAPGGEIILYQQDSAPDPGFTGSRGASTPGVAKAGSAPQAGLANQSTAPSTNTNAPTSTNTAAPKNPTAPNTQPKAAKTAESTIAQQEYPTGVVKNYSQEPINSVGEAFFNELGNDAKMVQDSILKYEAETGKKVAVNSRAFQNQIKQSLSTPQTWNKIFDTFGHKMEYPTSSTPNQSINQQIDSNYNTYSTDPVQTTKGQISTTLFDQGTQTQEEQLQQLLSLPADAPGETLLRNILMLELGAIEDPAISEYLDSQEKRAKDSYAAGLAMINLGNNEIDQAIDGTLSSATTTSGLSAKIAKQQLDLTQESINEQTSYENARNDIIVGDLRRKRADLVGYTKAKLYSMGAEDSSAGVALLGKIVSEADMQITLAELDHNHAVRTLNLEGRQAIYNYGATISGLVIDQKTQESNLADTLETNLDKIYNSRLSNEQEKRKETISLYANYAKEIMALQEKTQAAKAKALEDAYQKTKDLKEDAIKMSGLMGTLYVPDKDGNLIDTGIQTFAAKQFGSTETRDLMRIQLSTDDNRRQYAKYLSDTYGSQAAPQIEQLLGMPEGTLAGFQTKEDLDRALDYYKEANEISKFRVQEGLAQDVDKKILAYDKSGGGIKPAGIGIDPFSFEDVRKTALSLGTVTQSFSTTQGSDTGHGHGGTDYVSKDGYSRALRGGEVVSILPWNGNSDFGNVVRIKDDEGYIWQYAHMGNRDVPGDNPFNVQVGDRVNPGDVLGREGNTGRIITKKTGNLRGRHTDLRVVGKEDVSNTNEWIDKYVEKMGKYPTQDQRKVLRTQGEEGFKNLTMTQEERDLEKVVGRDITAIDAGIVDQANAGKASINIPWSGKALNFGGVQTKEVTYKDLRDEYVNLFNENPSSADAKLIQEYGRAGLNMIIKRKEESQKKKTGSITYS